MSYQTFTDAKGASKSDEKFQRIRLGDVSGKAVLDLGCNEGYFSNKAKSLGASKVIGIDQSQYFIDRAKQRFPDIDFRCQSWDILPEGKFDVIIFLSAIHYESDQVALLKRLHNALNPGGKLILECGVADGVDARWARVHRKVGSVLYPTQKLLLDHLLSDFAVRSFGESVLQAGDPVNRFVFHATPKEKTIMFVTGKSRAGKSNLCSSLSGNAEPFSLDNHLESLVKYERSELAMFLKQGFSVFQLANTYERLEASQLIEQYCDSVLESLPNTDLILVEGWALTMPKIKKQLINKAKNQHYRTWLTGPI